MARLPNFLVIIRSEKLSGKGQGRGVGVRKKERFVLGKRTFRSQKSKHFVLRIIDLSYFFGPAADSIQIDKVQYPDRTVVERCAMIRDSGDKTELVLEMWSRVKGDNLGVGVVIVILVSAGIMVVFTVYRKLQRYQHEKAQYRRRNHRRKK